MGAGGPSRVAGVPSEGKRAVGLALSVRRQPESFSQFKVRNL